MIKNVLLPPEDKNIFREICDFFFFLPLGNFPKKVPANID